MSVVNNMLRNLDKRHGQTSGQAAHGDSLRAVDAKPQWPFGAMQSVGIGLALCAGALAAWWMLNRSAPPTVIPAPPPPALAAMPTKPAPPLAASPAAATAQVAPTPAAPALAPATTASPKSKKIGRASCRERVSPSV